MIDKIDEVFVGEVTKPETLQGCCDNIDAVFSPIGITRQKDKLTYRDVDYQGNKNILDVALKKSVNKFIYVSVINAHRYENLEIIKAHEGRGLRLTRFYLSAAIYSRLCDSDKRLIFAN